MGRNVGAPRPQGVHYYDCKLPAGGHKCFSRLIARRAAAPVVQSVQPAPGIAAWRLRIADSLLPALRLDRGNDGGDISDYFFPTGTSHTTIGASPPVRARNFPSGENAI
jgi:hypothetical protein